MYSTLLRAALVRAVRTAAQSAIGVLGASSLITEVDWQLVVASAGFAAVLSLLTSIAGLPEVPEPEADEAIPNHPQEA